MWKIAIDCRFASLPVGLGTYTRNIVRELLPCLSEHEVILFVRSTTESWLRSLPSRQYQLVEVNLPHYSIQEQTAFPKIIESTGADLLFSPHFNVPLRCPIPFVVTIHDLILHRYPNQASLLKRIAYRMLMNHAVKRAQQIIAVSTFTASEIASVYGNFAAHKTTVIGEGIDTTLSKPSNKDLRDLGISPGYYLYVGNAKEHKNVRMLLSAYEASGSQTPLVLVSGGTELRQLRIPDSVTVVSDVTASQLSSLYAYASCFVTASLYEGFCLPVLEARAAGVPILACNTSAIPEIAGSHAVLVEPSEAALAHALKNPPTDSDAPPPEMNWKTAAQKTATILSSSLYG